MTLRAPALGAAALLMVVLGGCGGGDDPPGDPGTPSASSSSEVTSTTTETTAIATGPVEPTVPPEAESRGQAGVTAFVRFYWRVVNYAMKTGDVNLLARIDQPSCSGCAAGIQGINRVYRRGGKIVGGNYRVVALKPVSSDPEHWAVVTHTLVKTQRTVGAGNLNGTFKGGPAKWLVSVALVRGTWSVTTVELL
ncbi:DUF6318 family protein [Nocardioides sp. MH1]|uniref:DUF6318 family protein n=1 Tax=Nocardioides sp. MH1 TaxID=3242490 RepID=UPI0035217D0F